MKIIQIRYYTRFKIFPLIFIVVINNNNSNTIYCCRCCRINFLSHRQICNVVSRYNIEHRIHIYSSSVTSKSNRKTIQFVVNQILILKMIIKYITNNDEIKCLLFNINNQYNMINNHYANFFKLHNNVQIIIFDKHIYFNLFNYYYYYYYNPVLKISNFIYEKNFFFSDQTKFSHIFYDFHLKLTANDVVSIVSIIVTITSKYILSSVPVCSNYYDKFKLFLIRLKFCTNILYLVLLILFRIYVYDKIISFCETYLIDWTNNYRKHFCYFHLYNVTYQLCTMKYFAIIPL